MSALKRMAETAWEEAEEPARQKRFLTVAEREHALQAPPGLYLLRNAELHRIRTERTIRNNPCDLPWAKSEPGFMQVEDELHELDRKPKRCCTIAEHKHLGHAPIGTYLHVNSLLHQIHSERQARNSLPNLLGFQLESLEQHEERRAQKRTASEPELDINKPVTDGGWFCQRTLAAQATILRAEPCY